MDIVFGLLLGLVGDGLYDSLKDSIERRHITKIIKSLQDTATTKTISNHQTETYYNELDAYLTKNSIVTKVIQFCYNKSTQGFQSIDDFSTFHTGAFIEQNPNYLVYKNTVNTVFKNLYATIDTAINNYVLNEETRTIANKAEASKVEIMEQSQKQYNDLVARFESLSKRLDGESVISKASINDELLSDKAYEKYSQKIKDIMRDYQTIETYQKAIDELNSVISDIVGSVEELTSENRRMILLFLYDTQAQYYVNMGKLDKALQAIERAETQRHDPDKDEHKRHYFIKAYVLIQYNCDDKYREALANLNKAVALDNFYHSAVFLKHKLEASLSLSNYETQITILNDYYKDHVELSEDNTRTAEYYETLGFISKQYSLYEEAIRLLEKSEEYEHNISNSINIAIAYYNWATENCSNDASRHRYEVDYPKMIISLELMSGLLADPQKLHANLRKIIIPIYVAASHLCGQQDNVIHIAKYIDYFESDYQTVRNVIFERSFVEQISEHDLAMLTDEDKVILRMGRVLESEGEEKAIEFLEANLQAPQDGTANSLYQPLLGLYLKQSNVERYQSTIEQMKGVGLCDTYHDWHLVLLAEIAGELGDAKILAVKCLNEPLDTIIVYGIRNFFMRNKLDVDLVEFYSHIHLLLHQKMLLIDGIENFYGVALRFLIDENYAVARMIFDELPRNHIGEEAYHEMALMVYGKINDHASLIHSFGALYELRDRTMDKLLQAQSYKSICDINNAEQVINEVLKKSGLSNDEKSICYGMMSELCLYKEQFIESYEYAKQEAKLNEHIPSHRSHCTLLTRSMQCNKIEEGLADAVQHKHKHPIVTDWIKEIRTPTNADGSIDGDSLIAALNEATGGPNNFNMLLDYYRQKRLTIYHLSEIYKATLNNVLSWHDIYRLQTPINC